MYFLLLCSSISVQVLAEHVKGQFRLLILVTPYFMEAPWISTILNTSEDIPFWCPMVKDFIRNVSIGQMLKGLSSLHQHFGC